MEARIKLAAKLYRCRDSIKTLYGAEYHEKIKQYTHYIETGMKKYNLDELETAMKMIEDYKAEGITAVLLLAAAVEIAEPSLNK